MKYSNDQMVAAYFLASGVIVLFTFPLAIWKMMDIIAWAIK